MANTIKGFKINGVPHSLDAMFLSGATKEELLANAGGSGSSNQALNGLYVNASNNLELNAGAAGGEKLNLVADDAIQIKPGDGEPLQLDCEKNLVDVNEYGVKVCNGSLPKATRVVGLKLNAAELTLDTQKANTAEFEPDEFNIKIRNDKWNGGECVGSTGPIYAKVKARAFDFRCHDHGGIALQIAGHDNAGNENKIKFESDRTSVPGATATYCKEGGKGLEFGTFNNEHTSLYTGDYRFKGDANVFGVTRNTPVLDSKGKTDYPTQGDDFKDVIDASTPRATWNDIIDAAKKCKNLDETINNKVAEAAMSATGIDTSGFVTRDNVEAMVASAMSEMHIDTSGLASKEWVLDKHYIDTLPDAVQYLKMGKSKGNFAVDVTGKYTWELTSPKSATTVDDMGVTHIKGDRVMNYSDESFYTDAKKVYYKAGDTTLLADNVTEVPKDTIVYTSECNLTFAVPAVADGGYAYYLMNSADTAFYEDPDKFYFKCKAKKGDKYADGTDAAKGAIVQGAGLTQEELDYYLGKGEILDEEGNVVQAAIWEKTELWKKSTLWSKNEINVNLETDSKIKFAGKKIETVWTYEENGEDVDHKMAEILLSTESLAADANEVVFEQKISKNGDRSGQDTELVYSFGNNVADTTKVADFAAFKSNYNSKHPEKTDEELQAMYDAFLAEGESFEVRVKVSELLGLASRVTELEGLVSRVADLEARLAALEASGVQGPQGPAGADGAQGPQGPKGDNGANGADGADGAQGPQGPAGADGVVDETRINNLETLVSGEVATIYGRILSVSNTLSGDIVTVDNKVATLTTVVSGMYGTVGVQGPQGPAGANGAQGPQGPMAPEQLLPEDEGFIEDLTSGTTTGSTSGI